MRGMGARTERVMRPDWRPRIITCLVINQTTTQSNNEPLLTIDREGLFSLRSLQLIYITLNQNPLIEGELQPFNYGHRLFY